MNVVATHEKHHQINYVELMKTRAKSTKACAEPINTYTIHVNNYIKPRSNEHKTL